MTLGEDLRRLLGDIDIYLFDQIRRDRIAGPLLDVGCGHGRNLGYLLRAGVEVHGVDADARAIAATQRLAAELAPAASADRFHIADFARLPFDDARFATVLANAVLHFAADEATFEIWLAEMVRVLRPGGVLFARLASTVGMESRLVLERNRRATLPDGSERFLVDQPFLDAVARRHGLRALDPIKTVVVDNLRSMTTWVVTRA